MNKRTATWPTAAGLAAISVCILSIAYAFAADGTFDEYRSMLGDDNPAVFVVADGQDLWSQQRGPKNASLEQCDLGLGPGVVKGAYAQLPRYFADTGQVMSLESRLIHCMVKQQGMQRSDLIKGAYSGSSGGGTDLEALVAFIADQSRGTPINVPQSHAQEIAAYNTGKSMFYYRAGPYDFSCASCHRQSGKRIRLQELPNLTQAEDAKATVSTWPAYRISQGVVRSMGWRMQNCVRQQRLPELQPGSQGAVDLITFMGVNAKGGKMDAPGLKR